MKSAFRCLIVVVMLSYCLAKEIMCSKRSFVCYDQTSFYHCTTNRNGDHFIQGYLQSCPLGLVCNDLNEYECEEDISKEFLTDENYNFKFDKKEGRKHIIDD